MATDYISREAALDFLIPAFDLNISVQDQRVIGERFGEFLESIPAADVVEVVRCRECRDWNGNQCTSFFGLFRALPNDYCSRGVRCDHE